MFMKEIGCFAKIFSMNCQPPALPVNLFHIIICFSSFYTKCFSLFFVLAKKASDCYCMNSVGK